MKTSESSRTVEGINGPRVRQLSVFLENKVGTLLDVVRLINENHVEVVALSVQDSADSAIVRMIVSDPDRVSHLLHDHAIACQLCDIIVVELREATQLAEMLTCLLMAEVNMRVCYPLLIRPSGRSALAMHVEDEECTCAVLLSHGFKVLSQADISR